MANIYINSQLKLSRNHLQVKDVTDKWTTLHYQQGGLDGAWKSLLPNPKH